MKILHSLSSLVLLGLFLFQGPTVLAGEESGAHSYSVDHRPSYAIGAALVTNVMMAYDGLDVNFEVLIDGMLAQSEGKSALSDELVANALAKIESDRKALDGGELIRLTAEEKRVRSYALGVALAKDIPGAYQGVEVNYPALAAGFKEQMLGKSAMSDVAIQQELAKISQKLQGSSPQAPTSNGPSAGEQFLAENKGGQGVITTASGLQYTVLKEGKGPKARGNDIVTVNYTGTLLSGKVFDSTKGKKPIEFPVSGVIKGWQEALQLMNKGSKIKAWIPSELAYGPQGAGPIGPNEVLVFEIELLKIQAGK